MADASWREPPEEAPPIVEPVPWPGRSLAQAVATAVVLLAILASFYAAGRDVFFVLIAMVVSIALFEMMDALVHRGFRPYIPFGLLCGLGMMAAAYLERPAYLSVVLAVTLFGGFVLSLRPERGPAPANDVAWTLLGVVWVGGGGAAATSIMMLGGGSDLGLELLVAFVLVAALDDIGAYFVGTRFGRHKMAPSISPAKSWEGFAGGLVLAVAGGAGAGLLIDELGPGHGLVVGALCAVLAPAGDLVESLFKREMGIKDSGRLLPGHGGLLDRLDAIIFCAPAVFLYLRFAVL